VYTDNNLNAREYKIALLGILGSTKMEKDHIFKLDVKEFFEPNKGPPVFVQNPNSKIVVIIGKGYGYLLP
jgi:hypothetical protein